MLVVIAEALVARYVKVVCTGGGRVCYCVSIGEVAVYALRCSYVQGILEEDEEANRDNSEKGGLLMSHSGLPGDRMHHFGEIGVQRRKENKRWPLQSHLQAGDS